MDIDEAWKKAKEIVKEQKLKGVVVPIGSDKAEGEKYDKVFSFKCFVENKLGIPAEMYLHLYAQQEKVIGWKFIEKE